LFDNVLFTKKNTILTRPGGLSRPIKVFGAALLQSLNLETGCLQTSKREAGKKFKKAKTTRVSEREEEDGLGTESPRKTLERMPND